MASFGSFETDREVYSGPTYTVYSAKKSGDPTTEYAVKVFSLHSIGFDTEPGVQVDPLISDIERACAERIAVQQQAAGASPYVSPIFETGQDERGVWYVTRYYPRSVNRIISGKVALSHEALHHIMRAVAQGALDILRTCGRSHGEILPSNIQISRSERLRDADVVLSDPMPGDESQAAGFELSDLHALGRILLQLVLQRDISADESFALILPILPSPEWTRLFGKATNDWLALCNQLLDPNLALDQLTLEQVVARLDLLVPQAGVSPKLIFAIAAAVVCLGVVAFWFLRPHEQSIEITSDPPGAIVFVDRVQQDRPTPLKMKLKKGSYTIEAHHDALRLREQGTNVVAAGGADLKLHFQFAYGSVAISCEPRGTTILRDGARIGQTPADGSPFVLSNVAVGVEIRLQLTNDNYVSRDITRTVTTGQRLVVNEVLTKTEDTEPVEINSSPAPAKVYWKGNIVVEATSGFARLPRGPQTLTLVYKDWPPLNLNLDVVKGSPNSVTADFPRGTIRVESDPPDAAVWIGTNMIGQTPRNVPRPLGMTTFRFEHAGFESTNANVNLVDKGSTLNVKVVLLTTNGVFEFTADPNENTTVFDASGTELGHITPAKPLQVTLAPGTYSFTARTEGLDDVTRTLKVGRREILKSTFVFDYGMVQLESEPTGATISVDGKTLARTPAKFVQKPGNKINYRIVMPDYVPTNNEVSLAHGDHEKAIRVKLAPEPVDVTLTSDPPGAQFYVDTAVVAGARSTYSIPWGSHRVTAKYTLFPALGEISKVVAVTKGAPNAADFKFEYGTVVLTNLPDDVVIKEGDHQMAVAPGPVRLSYEKRGTHTYDFYDGGQKVETLTTNVEIGLVTVLQTKLVGEVRNSISMRLVKVRDLLGPGKDCFVGKFEVTEAEFKEVMGIDPSVPPRGPDYPVVNVTWGQATEFCKRLQARDEQKPPARGTYRLPTKDEWLAFAKGTRSEDAVLRATGPSTVGSKPANPQRLYDVQGNVWEWLADNDGSIGNIIGQAFNISWGPYSTTDRKQLTFSENTVGFRVILVPTSPTTAAK